MYISWALHCSVPASILHQTAMIMYVSYCLVTYSHLQDPQRNRIYQWQGVELETGLIELSFPLTSDPMQGSYKIVVQKSVTSHVEHSFSVEEYGKERREGLQAGLTEMLFTVASQFGICWEWHEDRDSEYIGNGVQGG